MEKNILPEMVDNFNSLPVHLQEHVLKYIKKLKNDLSDKKNATNLSRFAGSIPPDDLEIMREAIEKECRQVDIDGWYTLQGHHFNFFYVLKGLKLER